MCEDACAPMRACNDSCVPSRRVRRVRVPSACCDDPPQDECCVDRVSACSACYPFVRRAAQEHSFVPPPSTRARNLGTMLSKRPRTDGQAAEHDRDSPTCGQERLCCLDIGGTTFVCSTDTLAESSGYFHALFNFNKTLKRNAEGQFVVPFIDRSGELFDILLDAMRQKAVPYPKITHCNKSRLMRV